MKNSVLDNFPPCPPAHPPLKSANFIFIVVSLSLRVSKPGCFPLFSGKVQIVSRTLLGLFLVGALNRLRKRKRTNRENPRTIPAQIGKIPGKVPKGQKRTKKEGQVQIGKPPRLKHPRLAALNKQDWPNQAYPYCWEPIAFIGRLIFFTTTGADASGCSTGNWQ